MSFDFPSLVALPNVGAVITLSIDPKSAMKIFPEQK
jgi:hypothetical protein